jgi:hypothetical protein
MEDHRFVSTHSPVNIRVVEFFTDVKEVMDEKGRPTGDVKLIDKVRYAPPGLLDRQVVVASIAELARVHSDGADSDNPAVRAAFARWQYIQPLYERWKQGEAPPESGTPLGVVTFLRKEEVDMLKRQGIKTVEEFIDTPSKNLERVGLPHLTAKLAQARAFIEAADRNRVAAHVAAKEAEIEDLKKQMAELTAAFAESKAHEEA